MVVVVVESKPCPECGGEMHKEIKLMSVSGVTYPAIEWWVCDNIKCGHEEKVR